MPRKRTKNEPIPVRVEKNQTNSTRVTKNDAPPKGPILQREDFNHIKFTDSQLKFFRTIENNFLTVCTGPAGCLTKKEKIKVYIMKTKTDSRNVQTETDNPNS